MVLYLHGGWVGNEEERRLHLSIFSYYSLFLSWQKFLFSRVLSPVLQRRNVRTRRMSCLKSVSMERALQSKYRQFEVILRVNAKDEASTRETSPQRTIN